MITSLLARPGDVRPPGHPAGAAVPATLLRDLRLDEIARRLGGWRADPLVAELIATPLADPDAVAYRQEVFRDLDIPVTAAALRRFTAGIGEAQGCLEHAAKTRHPLERDRWQLGAMDRYVEVVEQLLTALESAPIRSRALVACRADLRAYLGTADFAALRGDARSAADGLGAVRYRLRIGEQRITVGPAGHEANYLDEVRDAFARFRAPDASEPASDSFATVDMNPLETQVLERVARMAPAPLAAMTQAVRRHAAFLAPGIAALATEASFYLAWQDLLAPLEAVGLRWCLPEVVLGGSVAQITGAYDVALAAQLAEVGAAAIGNDFDQDGAEPIIVITGPNRSGKTAFARAIGQIHLLAAAGCPVPATAAIVPLVDAVYTQADRAEGLTDPGGRLELDLRQVVGILDRLTARGLVIFNEAFASTTVEDALALNRVVLDEVLARGARAVTVTFLHELASGPSTVSLVCGSEHAGASGSPFSVTRRAPEGLAHAQSIAASHGLAYADVRARAAR